MGRSERLPGAVVVAVVKLLWTTREIADACGVSRAMVFKIIKQHPERFRPPAFGCRNSHRRKHRIFDQEEAQFIFQVLAGRFKSGDS